MKIFINLLLLVLAVFISSCSTDDLDVQTDSLSEIKLSKTSCFGTCPIFDIQLNKNLEATLVVTNFVDGKEPGQYKTTITEDEWLKLSSMIIKMKFRHLKGDYGDRTLADSPSANSAITFKDGYVKEVRDYGANGTKDLRSLYTNIDDLVNRVDWRFVE
ncbi:DUF6438 domain-containing protein [Sphingobacterium corticis]|uniref:DUF6438 domain-containing protein n=1 Tax=Sphingobacterium corticis TaxID=1812823 RepID=A0ABW5NJD3_9SPHI